MPEDSMNAIRTDTLAIDVISDVVCPWCYVGKRRLETALQSLAQREPGLAATVRWHPFQLNPELPDEGVPRRRYLEAKFGGATSTAAIYARVSAAGAEAGVTFAFDAIDRQPNTLDAHRLVTWAQAQPHADASALVERLFHAYFVEGRFVGDREELARIAGEAGYDAGAASGMLASGALRDEVTAADERARAMGISGVPFFVFGGRVALSGAHEPATILDAIRQARSPAPERG
jgi:predicted DsbA family dithiol-disulfide isomerase